MTKGISLSDEAYNELKKLKREGESFSKVVVKLTEKEKNRGIMAFAGAWKDRPEMDRISKKVLEERKKFRSREVKF